MIITLRNLVLIILFSQTLISCRWIDGIGSPFFSWTNIKIPDGTPTFQRGFKDGCSTVLHARGNDYYHTRYKYRYDPNLIGNTEYRFGHQRGYSFCFQMIVGPSNSIVGSPDRFLFHYGNGAAFDPKPGSINDQGLFGDSGNNALSSSLTTPGTGLNSMFDVWQKGNDDTGVGGGGSGTAFGGNPLWAGGSSGYFLGWY